MKRRTRAALLVALAAGVVFAATEACTIVNGLVADVPDTGTTPTIDAGDAGPEASPPGPRCAKPPPPTGLDDGTDLEVIAIAKEIILATPGSGSPVGFDLDDSCTVEAPLGTCNSKAPIDDGDGGLDNRAATIFQLVNDRTDLQKTVNEGIKAGKNAVLVRLTKYNGKADDPSVAVSIYASPGHYDDAGNNDPPQFLESEQWALDDAQFNPITGLPVATVTGYVSGGKIVAYFSGTIALSSSFSVVIQGGVLVADLDLSGPKPAISGGVFAGRWPITDILHTVGQQRLSDGGANALCEPSQQLVFEIAKSQICDNLDIMSDPTRDRQNQRCDALSAGFAFLGGKASLGARKVVTPNEECPGWDAGACAN